MFHLDVLHNLILYMHRAHTPGRGHTKYDLRSISFLQRFFLACNIYDQFISFLIHYKTQT